MRDQSSISETGHNLLKCTIQKYTMNVWNATKSRKIDLRAMSYKSKEERWNVYVAGQKKR